MDELKKCKFCSGDIPKEREKNAMSKSVIFCSKRCGGFWYRREQKLANPKPIKKCLWCTKPTNEVKRWCDSDCRSNYLKNSGENYNGPAKEKKFGEVDKWFTWE